MQLIDPPPTGLGSPQNPVNVAKATFNVIARDEQGNVIPNDVNVDVFISFGGVKTGANSACGADESRQRAHRDADAQGRHADEPLGDAAAGVRPDARSGSTSRCSRRDRRVADDLLPQRLHHRGADAARFHRANATFCSPFNGKFLIFDHATGSGQLVVTSVFGNAFAVTDTGVHAWPVQQHLPVRVRQAARRTSSRGKRASTRSRGNCSKFVGFTELNFPLFNVADETVPLATVPPPVVMSPATSPTLPKMLGASASVVTLHGRHLRSDVGAPNAAEHGRSTTSSCSTTTASATRSATIAIELPAEGARHVRSAEARRRDGDHHRHAAQQLGAEPVPRRQRQRASPARRPCRAPRARCITGTCYKNPFNFWTINPRRQEDIVLAALITGKLISNRDRG